MIGDLSMPAFADECQCPEDWKLVPLRQIGDVRFSSVDKLTRSSEEPVRLCNYTDVYNNNYISRDLQFMEASATQPEIERFRLQVGDVIITKDSETPNDIGIPAVVDYAAPDLICGYHLGLIRPKLDEVDPTFLAKQLAHSRLALYFGRQANGLTRYGLPLAAVQKAPLWLPDIGRQQVVGAILRQVDEATVRTEAVIAKLKQVGAGLLHDLLTRGLAENGELRDPTAHPEQFKVSALGTIPALWDVVRLDCLADVIDPQPDHRAPAEVENGVPYVGVGDFLPDGSISFESCRRVSVEALARQSQRFRIQPGDIMFGKIGTIGLPRILTEGSYALNANTVLIKPFDPFSFVFWLLNSRQVEAAIVTDIHSTSQPAFGIQKIRALAVPCPPDEKERENIARLLDRCSASIQTEDQLLSKLRSLKAGLIADLLTGRVRVPECVVATEAHA